MKRRYVSPKVEIVKIDKEDILTESTAWENKPGDVGSL